MPPYSLMFIILGASKIILTVTVRVVLSITGCSNFFVKQQVCSPSANEPRANSKRMGDNHFRESSGFHIRENLQSNLTKSLHFMQAKLSPVKCSVLSKVVLLAADLTKTRNLIKVG